MFLLSLNASYNGNLRRQLPECAQKSITDMGGDEFRKCNEVRCFPEILVFNVQVKSAESRE